jgi:hypothetical protein
MLSRQNRSRIDNEAGQFVYFGGGATGRLNPGSIDYTEQAAVRSILLDDKSCRLAEKILPG